MNQLLLQVGELIKQQKDGDVFDISSLTDWNPQMDVELNQLIKTYQICGIRQHSFDGKVWKYTATFDSNYAIYIPDSDLISKATALLNRAEQYKDLKGYSKELQDYCRELSSVATQIIDAQGEFMDFNHSIIKALIGHFRLEIAMVTDSTYYYVAAGGDPLISRLHSLHDVCAKHLLNQ